MQNCRLSAGSTTWRQRPPVALGRNQLTVEGLAKSVVRKIATLMRRL